MRREGVPEADVRRAIAMLDSNGLTFEGRTPLDDDKREFALDAEQMAHFGFTGAERYSLETVIRHVRPTMLIGTSGTPGSFTEGAIREMAKHVKTPIVFPLSNPTSKTEAAPADILEWTEGRAIVATGSPFDPVPVEGVPRIIGQANNAFCFPGIGLGAVVAEAREVTDEMFLCAAEALASVVSSERLEQGSLYPNQSELRVASRAVAIEVARAARDGGVGRNLCDDEVESAVDAMMWEPCYLRYEPA
jgi:malic enzyme